MAIVVSRQTLFDTEGDLTFRRQRYGAANVPHRFVNNGPGVPRQIDIHATGNILTEWLEG